MSLGENISYLRKQKRMTQEQFSERMNVTRQTVSRWEAEEVVPELTKLVDMCSMFSCSLDALVREKLSEKSRIYSDISVQKIAGFRMAHYAIISQNPEDDANNYMERWAMNSGLKSAFPEARMIGWDFPFVSPEQQNRFGMHGYAAAYVLPEGFETEYPGVQYSENKEADYAVITIREPFIQPFDCIPNAYKLVMEYIRENRLKEKLQDNILECFEYEYQKEGVTYMDVYLHVDGATKIDGHLRFNAKWV